MADFPYKLAEESDLQTLAEVNALNRKQVRICAVPTAGGDLLIPKDALRPGTGYCHEQAAFVASLPDYEVEKESIQWPMLEV